MNRPPPGDAALASQLRLALSEQFGLSAKGVSDAQLDDAARAAGWTLSSGVDALARVVDSLPICESAVFRNPDLWRYLAADVLPPLVSRALKGGAPLRAVSLGCSQGQEVYSLAMKVVEAAAFCGAPRAQVQKIARLLGIDASASRIDSARSGELSAWSLDRGRREWATPYIEDSGGGLRVAKDVLALCRFEVGNLLEVVRGVGPAGLELSKLDLVMCQHVLVYFDEERGRGVISSLVERLAPGAMLVVAAPEAHLLDHPLLERAGFVGTARVKEKREKLPPPRPLRPVRARPTPATAPQADLDGWLSSSLRHAASGRVDEAWREAERIWQLQPSHLMSRFELGQALLASSPPKAKLLLQKVIELGSALPPSSSVPGADELSVGQMVAAARLLLGGRGTR